MTGLCKLCGKSADLRESHHIPRFVIQWLKKTGGGYFRRAVNPNKREQDGPKEYWLCESCEQRFATREAYFANEIFHPVIDGKNPLPYDERFFYCLVSINWRTIIGTQSLPGFSRHKFAGLVATAEQDWREYLLGNKARPKFDTIHVFISDVTTGQIIPTKKFNSYFVRAIDATVGSSNTQCFVYTKFGRFVIFAYLTSCPEELWIDTQIRFEGGVFNQPQEMLDGSVGEFLVNRAEVAFKEYEARATVKTRDAITRHFQKSLPSLLGSEQLRVQAADFEAIVRPPGANISRKVGRNEPCPCGSGKKFKRCHGR